MCIVKIAYISYLCLALESYYVTHQVSHMLFLELVLAIQELLAPVLLESSGV
jgi:hypothetical protein